MLPDPAQFFQGTEEGALQVGLPAVEQFERLAGTQGSCAGAAGSGDGLRFQAGTLGFVLVNPIVLGEKCAGLHGPHALEAPLTIREFQDERGFERTGRLQVVDEQVDELLIGLGILEIEDHGFGGGQDFNEPAAAFGLHGGAFRIQGSGREEGRAGA